MPDIMNDFRHLHEWDTTKIMDRRLTLIASAPDGDMKKLPDEVLVELLAIARILRTRTTAPKVASSKKAPAPTLDAL